MLNKSACRIIAIFTLNKKYGDAVDCSLTFPFFEPEVELGWCMRWIYGSSQHKHRLRVGAQWLIAPAIVNCQKQISRIFQNILWNFSTNNNALVWNEFCSVQCVQFNFVYVDRGFYLNDMTKKLHETRKMEKNPTEYKFKCLWFLLWSYLFRGIGAMRPFQVWVSTWISLRFHDRY